MIRCIALAALLVLPCAASSLAQTEPAVPLAAPSATAPSATDLQALNVYLQQQDQASADAELRRLRAKFPGWVPPADLSKLTVTQPSAEIDTIYRQIAAGQLAEARATITATQNEYTNWVAPDDMIRLLETAEGQIRLDAALDAGNAAEALEIASSTDGLLRCDRVNNAWRIAQAQEAQQANAAALGTYRAIVGACTAAPDIIATLEKSGSVTSDAELIALFDLATRRFPEQAADLAALQTRMMLGRGAAPAQIALQPDTKIRPRARPAEGSTAPVAARPAAPLAEASAQQAEAAAPPPQGGESAPAGSGTGCLAATNGATSAARLAERGWCAYNLERPMEALSAFRSAESRARGAARRDARFGMALSYLKMNMTEEASRIAATTDLTHQQRVDTETIILDQRGVLAFQKRQYRKAIGYFDALEQVSGHLRRDLAILRGYAYLNSGNRTKARALFQELHDQLATTETRKALAAAY